MKILDVLQVDAIQVDLKSKDKKSVIEELSAPVARIAGIDAEDIARVLMEREQLGSTGIGGGIAIPHGKLKNIESLILGFGLSRGGVDFESMDNRPAHIFLLVTPDNSAGLHLKLLARISRILKNDPFKEKLLNVNSADEVMKIIGEEDETFLSCLPGNNNNLMKAVTALDAFYGIRVINKGPNSDSLFNL